MMKNVYMISAKYGAYIGDLWPSPSNTAFTFGGPPNETKTMYTWSAYYGSLYCRLANDRGSSDSQGDHPDINGIYNYMTAELCLNRDGTDIINENQVHHLVAYFGNRSDLAKGRLKNYHILYEAIDGIYNPEEIQTILSGDAYTEYPRTTWTTNTAHAGPDVIGDRSFYEQSAYTVISNLQPQYQLGSDLEGYELIYSCYNTPQTNEHHIYFFYTPKQYTITFKYEDEADWKTDSYYYTESLTGAKKYEDPEKEGYRFLGWYTNEAGAGEPFDFESEKMPARNLVLYPVFEPLSYVVKIDPNGGVIDRWHAGSPSSGASTGFRANYKETISSYDFLEHNFIHTNDQEIETLGLNPETDIYYYMNAQYISEEHDGRFIPSALRNALYLTESGIDEYWSYYSSFTEEAFTERGAVKITDRNEWMDYYFGGHDIGSLPKYRMVQASEKYTFEGWFQVFNDGSVATVPYDFNTPITHDLEIRAKWRLNGGYYIQYNPDCFAEDEEGRITDINGEVEQWTDPANPSGQLYADQSLTNILHAPTNVTEGWIFRGWRVVKAEGTNIYTDQGKTVTYTNWVPIEFDENGDVIYYSPGDEFTVDSILVSEIPEGGNGSIIHMQAYYEPEDSSYRRPDITNLILDANDPYGGYVNTTDQAALLELDGPGRTVINTDTELDDKGHPTQILFGDFQSNIALHLYRYATNQTVDNIQGSDLFSNADG